MTLKAGNDQVATEICSFWKEQRDLVDQRDKAWKNKSANIISRYRDDRTDKEVTAFRRMNVLWANVKILKPALYGKTPIPVIERKFLDRDPKGRLSAQILERAVANEIEDNGYNDALSRAVDDYLLPGRGVVWARYESEIGKNDSLPSAEHNSMEDDYHTALAGESTTSAGNDLPPVNIKDDPELNDDKEKELNEDNEELIAERVPLDYIDYRDFRMYPSTARTWREVMAVSKTIYMSKVEAIKRFGEDIAKDMKPDTSYNDAQASGQISLEERTYRNANMRNIVVEEIWNKIDRKVIWVCTGYSGICDVKDDLLELKDFFPVPKPLSSTLTNDSVVPVPDYIEYQDQALQIDELTQRIAMLTKACKVAGTYNGANDALKRLLDEGFENQLIAVDDWATHAEGGGVEGNISFLPIKDIQEVIRTLIEVRSLAMQDMDLITGISDIVRGTTDSRETLGGIRLKNNNAGTRLSDRQNEVAQFAKNAIAIIAEIMAKHYDDNTLIEQSGIKLEDELQIDTVINELKAGKKAKQLTKPEPQNQPPMQQPGASPMGPQSSPMPPMGSPPPAVAPNGPGIPPPPQMGAGGMPKEMQPPPIDPAIQEAIEEELLRQEAEKVIEEKLNGALALLRDDIKRSYRIDIETDSTVFGDAMQERQDATEFITAVTGFMEKAGQMMQIMPNSGPVLGRMLQWGVRKFRTGRDLESAIDAFVSQAEQQAKDNKENPKMSPEEQKAQMDAQIKQQEIAHQKQMQEMEMRAQEANDQRDVMKQQMEDQRQQQLMQVEMQMKQQELEFKKQEMEMKKQLLLLQHQLEERKLNMESQHQEREMAMKTEQAHQQHSLAMTQAQQQHQMAEQKHQQSIQAADQKHKLGMEANQQKHSMMKEQSALKAKQAKKPKKAA